MPILSNGDYLNSLDNSFIGASRKLVKTNKNIGKMNKQYNKEVNQSDIDSMIGYLSNINIYLDQLIAVSLGESVQPVMEGGALEGPLDDQDIRSILYNLIDTNHLSWDEVNAILDDPQFHQKVDELLQHYDNPDEPKHLIMQKIHNILADYYDGDVFEDVTDEPESISRFAPMRFDTPSDYDPSESSMSIPEYDLSGYVENVFEEVQQELHHLYPTIDRLRRYALSQYVPIEYTIEGSKAKTLYDYNELLRKVVLDDKRVQDALRDDDPNLFESIKHLPNVIPKLDKEHQRGILSLISTIMIEINKAKKFFKLSFLQDVTKVGEQTRESVAKIMNDMKIKTDEIKEISRRGAYDVVTNKNIHQLLTELDSLDNTNIFKGVEVMYDLPSLEGGSMKSMKIKDPFLFNPYKGFESMPMKYLL